jgi:hypothetical protein
VVAAWRDGLRSLRRAWRRSIRRPHS